MVEYSTCARQEVRARQKNFQYDILWSILYILGIFKIRISVEFVAVGGFECWAFSWKIRKKYKFLKILKNLKIFGKKSNFKKKFQTSNCFQKFAFWVMTKQKNCNEILSWRLHLQKNFWCARTSARGARWISCRSENSRRRAALFPIDSNDYQWGKAQPQA